MANSDARFVIKASRDGTRQFESFGGSSRFEGDRRPIPERPRGRGNFRGRRGRSRGGYSYRGRGRGRGGGLNPRSRLDGDDGDFDGEIEMREDALPARRRFTPYGRPPSSHHRDRESDPSESFSMGGRREYWSKIIILGGAQHNQDWLLRQLHSSITEAFEPVEFHLSGQAACFYIKEERAAQQLKSCKIRTRDGPTLSVIVKVGLAPQIRDGSFSQRKFPTSAIAAGGGVFHATEGAISLKTEDAIRSALGGRYDSTANTLNLSNFYNDEVLKQSGERVILGRANHMEAVMKIVSESCPQLQGLDLSSNRLSSLDSLKDFHSKLPNLQSLNLSDNQLRFESELDNLKSLSQLKSISLEENPFTLHYKTSGSYISAVQNRLGVTELDGQVIPARIGFDLPSLSSLPETKDGYCADARVRDIIHKFLETYYSCYDAPRGRERLLEAYTENALFSLSVSTQPAGKPQQSFRGPPLGDYVRQSRNLMRVRDPGKSVELLKRGRLCIASFLNELPRTKHEPSTFRIDVSFSTPRCVIFSVYGAFQEDGSSDSRVAMRSFTRLFVCIQSDSRDGGLLIANDQLQIRNASLNQRKLLGHGSISAGLSLASASTTSTTATATATALLLGGFSQQQLEMVAQFSKESGMNFEWSQKCLAENNWVYIQAAQAFTVLQTNSSIPPEAFN